MRPVGGAGKCSVKSKMLRELAALTRVNYNPILMWCRARLLAQMPSYFTGSGAVDARMVIYQLIGLSV